MVQTKSDVYSPTSSPSNRTLHLISVISSLACSRSLRPGDSIIRVLDVQGDRVLVIDCIKRTMPVWVERATLESCSECASGRGFIRNFLNTHSLTIRSPSALVQTKSDVYSPTSGVGD